MYHDEGHMRAKVLGELVNHVMSLHGSGSKPQEVHVDAIKMEKPHEISSELPKPDGLPKHSHKDSMEAPILEAHGGKVEEEHDLNDLFGRKKDMGRECF